MFIIREVLVGVKGDEIKQVLEQMQGEVIVPVYDIVNMGKLENSENFAFEILAAIPQDLIDLEKLKNVHIESLVILGIPKEALKQVQEVKPIGIAEGQSEFTFKPFEV